MSGGFDEHGSGAGDVGPGFLEAAGRSVRTGVRGYVTGLGLAILLTAASFYVAGSGLVWAPAIPIALVVLATIELAGAQLRVVLEIAHLRLPIR